MNPRPIQSRADTVLLVLRLVAGGIMLAHGGQKLFVFGFAGVTQAFTHMGVPAPAFTGPFIALVEFFGALAIITGLLTRLAALGLACDMLGAILLMHLKNGFFNPMGIEFPLSLLGTYVALMIGGPGRFSLDAAIARRRASTTV